ncbi:MAG: glycosyltransferase family 8 protein [Treponema sp.]|nr:glycosyltransferase family 8 protein [Treponema sp.]
MSIFSRKIEEIPIFFASDNNYAPYLAVALKSLLSNASSDYFYKIHILTTKLDEEICTKLLKLKTDNSSIQIISLADEIEHIKNRFQLRDYYSIETYYRFFIPDLFPQYDKVLYLDCDITVLGDISNLYLTNISNFLVAAAQEQVMAHYKVFGDYVEKALDVKVKNYFNAGVLLMNTKMFRACRITQKFFKMMSEYKFRVTQDEDYLNVICKDKVKKLNIGWNKMPFEETGFDNLDLQLIHYNLGWKPWHYEGVLYEEYFWQYAQQTEFYEQIHKELKGFTDEQRQRDKDSFEKLKIMAIEDINDPDNYRNSQIKAKNYISRGLKTFGELPYIKGIKRVINAQSSKFIYKYFTGSENEETTGSKE